MKHLKKILVAILIILGTTTAIAATTTIIPITPALFETALVAPQSGTDTTLTLANGNLVNGNPLTGFTCFTIDSGQANVEYECGTAAGASVTGITRGIDPLTGTSTDASLVFTHRRGADVKITDFPFTQIIGRIIGGQDSFPAGIVTSATSSFNGAFNHFGNFVCKGSLANVGQALELCGDSNSDSGGVQIQSANNDSGGQAFAGFTVNNDLADNTFSHFAGFYLNSSGYNSTTFGTGIAVPNLGILQNTDGPLAIIASTSTTQGYIPFFTNGTATTNERMRITSAGLVGIGTKTPATTLDVAGTSTLESGAIIPNAPVNNTDAANKAYVDSVAVSGAPNANTTTKGIIQIATGAQAAAGTGTGSTGALLVLPASLATSTSQVARNSIVVTNSSGIIDSSFLPPSTNGSKYGGTGADGALSITSGTTTVNLSNAAVVIKNYTSISITGTGALGFSNPNTNGSLIVLKSQGACTFTSGATPLLDASGMGAAGGASTNTTAAAVAGNNGTNGLSISFLQSNFGVKATTGAVGAGGAMNTLAFPSVSVSAELAGKYPLLYTGSGGASGMAVSNSGTVTASGAGGNGGGGLIIECGGTINFTTANGITVQGKNGASGTDQVAASVCGAGGGGGGGGFLFLTYNTATAVTGTALATGGIGGNTSPTCQVTGYGGGGGGSSNVAGSPGTSSSSNSAKTGGNGATGYSFIGQNTEY